jgi:cholesterol transport system auxiliary component
MMTGAGPTRSWPMRRDAPGRLRAVAAASLLLPLAACSGGALNAYDLSAVRPPAQRALRSQLRIAEPTATIDLDSDRILVRTGPQQLAVLAGAKWPDRLPVILQARLTQSFQNAGLLRQVSARPSFSAGYELDLDIRKFDLVVARSRIEIDIAAKILNASGGIAAAQIFTMDAPVASTAPADVSAAMNSALSSAMTRIVAFTAARI